MSNLDFCPISRKHATKNTDIIELRECNKFHDADGQVVFHICPTARSLTGRIVLKCALSGKELGHVRRSRRHPTRHLLSVGRFDKVGYVQTKDATPRPDRCLAEIHLIGNDEIVASHREAHGANTDDADDGPTGGPPPQGTFFEKKRADTAAGCTKGNWSKKAIDISVGGEQVAEIYRTSFTASNGFCIEIAKAGVDRAFVVMIVLALGEAFGWENDDGFASDIRFE